MLAYLFTDSGHVRAQACDFTHDIANNLVSRDRHALLVLIRTFVMPLNGLALAIEVLNFFIVILTVRTWALFWGSRKLGISLFLLFTVIWAAVIILMQRQMADCEPVSMHENYHADMS